jgi:hypothetical protein
MLQVPRFYLDRVARLGARRGGDGKISPSLSHPDITDTGVPPLIRPHAVDPGEGRNQLKQNICILKDIRDLFRSFDATVQAEFLAECVI